MKIAVCIVGFRNAPDILACLKALSVSTYDAFEVVVCENGGAEAAQTLRHSAPDLLAGRQRVTIIEAPGNVGYAGGVNIAMAAAATADAWWILNPDTQPDRHALKRLVARLNVGDCHAVGGVLVGVDGSVQSAGGQWQTYMGRAVSMARGTDSSSDLTSIEARMDFISGASALVGREFLSKVGFMRQDYFLYCEEVEWFLRGKQKGMVLGLAPQAQVFHDAGGTTGSGLEARQLPKLPVYLNERNRLLLTRDLTPLLMPIVACGALAVILARYVRRLAWRQVAYALEGWWAGLMNLRGPPSWIDAPTLPAAYTLREL